MTWIARLLFLEALAAALAPFIFGVDWPDRFGGMVVLWPIAAIIGVAGVAVWRTEP